MKMLLSVVVWILIVKSDAKQDEFVQRHFEIISNISVEANFGHLTRLTTDITSPIRCASLCVELECKCSSFLFDNMSRICHMFTKTLTSGNGTSTGANKITECASPREIANANLVKYTGCVATYSCQPDHVNRNSLDSLSCQSGETWPNANDVVCVPISIKYDFAITTSDITFAATNASVYVELFGEYGNFILDFPDTVIFPLGMTTKYSGLYPNVGKLSQIKIGHDNSRGEPNWHLKTVSITTSDIDVYVFRADVWLRYPYLSVVLYPE